MKEEKIFLTPDEAKALLSDEESIHTFRSDLINVLVGCDWPKDEIIKAIDNNPDKIEIGGSACKAMGHGLVIWTGKTPLFVEVDKDKLQAIEDSKTNN